MNNLLKNSPNSTYRQKGAIFILFAFFLVAILAFSALAINVGNYFVVRNQLQNAADAAALSGANYLYPADDTGKPQWTLAQSKATTAVSYNKADGITLTNATVETGYWDFTGVAGFRSLATPGINDAAAVKVTLKKTAGQNGGPLSIFFGSFIGVSTMDITVSAIAAVGFTSSVPPGFLFPVALPQNLYNTYWNGGARKDPATGKPYTHQISGSGTNGQWTSFNVDSNNVPYIRELMENGNPVPYKIGDEIYLVPGSKTALYGSVPENVDVLIPVVETASGGLQVIVGFGIFHIDFAVGGSGKYIQGNMMSSYKVTEGEIGGGNFGVHLPPRLVK